jgi:alpha-D-ribose 1-methylphosphonate 5-triphosphate synthase subunit PhnH
MMANIAGLDVTSSIEENDILVVTISIATFQVGQFECVNGRGIESINTAKISSQLSFSVWSDWSEWSKW